METVKNDIRMLQSAVSQAPLWQPGNALSRQCEKGLEIITGLEERLDRKLVVTLLGPCGAGKSTLLNALAGADDLTEVGTRRPTTRKVFVLARNQTDAAQLVDRLPQGAVTVRTRASAEALDNAVLVDTPDTDSTEAREHVALVEEVIELSDVLVCVFDAENPKRRDQADFLAPYVRRFGGDSILVALNKCDRLAESELKQTILPEFEAYIEAAWDRPADTVACVSARSHLRNPAWSPTATPRHSFDQFESLRRQVFNLSGRTGHTVDRRLDNAMALRDYLRAEVAAEVEKDLAHLTAAATAVVQVEKEALQAAVAALSRTNDRQTLGVNVLVYQRLAQQWLGPVGWLMAIWSRILIFGTGVAAMLRFGSPLRQVWGMVSTLRQARDAREAVSGTTREARVADALRSFRNTVARGWPDIAESLVAARFDSSIRRESAVLQDSDTLDRELNEIWSAALYRTIDRAARHLSGPLLQLVFNAPSIAMLAYAGWLTGRDFVLANYRTADFFLHAFLAVAAVLFLSFFLLQGCVRVTAGTDRLISRAFGDVKTAIEQFDPLSASPVGNQIRCLLNMVVKD
jgi:GTP-binding protein EngB required for normal cell division